MVNEHKNGDIYMNSTSLEDVAHNEPSDTRAQSVTSIHTNGPDTPTYEELQTRLETSNRNIQNIKDQQQQLIQLQQAAKQHLSDMENIRNQHNRPAHFNQNGSAPPQYETVEQVHSDMSNLVNRMKNLTTFIQGQHELSDMLGDDGPEILAEQEALQKKLEELKAQKQEMKNLVSELQEVNNSAETSLHNQLAAEENAARTIPLDYERVVPIELIGSAKLQVQNGLPNGHSQNHNGVSSNIDNSNEINEHERTADESEEAIAETNEMIRQKMADINTMKSQLKRLKDMMETVSLIEAKTDSGKSVKEIADEAETPTSIDPPSLQSANIPKNIHRDSVPDKDDSTTAEEEVMSERVRLLHEMTQDLRDQAVHLASERDRLKAIKEEMQRRRDMECGVSNDKISNREASPGPISNGTHQSKDSEKHLIKEYEAKKKEFEKLCQRLKNEDELVRDEEVESNAPEAIESSEIKREPGSASYYSDNWRRSHVVSSNSSVHGGKQSAVPLTPIRGKDSADSGAADVHGVASTEGGSLQSGSSRSLSMPPPMRNINTRDTTWRKNSQDNSQSQFDHYAPPPPPLPAWNPSYYYSTPYSQQFSPHCHHHMMMSANSAGGEYFCPHQIHSNAVNSTTSTSTQQQQVSAQSSGVTSSDPVLLQQFIQTQQMLINSVCQCNQLLWHQQREINNLNNAVLLLQERLLNSNNSDIAATINASMRAESVPPTGVTVSNNLYTTANRAQSEQPHPNALPTQTYPPIAQPPPMSPGRHYQTFNYATNSYQQQQRRHLSNIQQHGPNQAIHHTTNSAYNFSSSEAGAGYCSQLPPPHSGVSSGGQHHQATIYNNTVHHSNPSNFSNNDIVQNGPPPPIFMHHHNNTITPSSCNAGANMQQQHHTNNNSNLNMNSQQQNCLNSPSANISQSAAASAAAASVPNTSNAAAAAAALNNQVPPGNRANNYWDNFRSYSRQNLLSSNSCKSNEEQHHHQQQQHLSTSPFGTTNSGLNANSNGLRNLQYLNVGSSGNSSSNSNNLTPPIFDNKYFHTFRNQFNNNIGGSASGSGQQQPQPSHHNQAPPNAVVVPTGNTCNSQNGLANVLSAVDNMEIIEPNQMCENQQQHQSSNLMNQIHQSDNLNINQELYNFNNNNNNNANNCNNSNASNNVAAIFGSPDFRNMNFNFGVNEFRKKIPFKTSYNTKRLRHTQQMINDVNAPNQRYHTNSRDNGENREFLNHTMGQGLNRPSSSILFSQNDANIMMSGAGNINEASDEIKRNLLVNALKSDKFTSKFFESLKEDVYREVYAIIQATESHPHYLVQLFKELQLISTTDPLRNIVMQAMHDLYKRSCNGSSNNEEMLELNIHHDEGILENQSLSNGLASSSLPPSRENDNSTDNEDHHHHSNTCENNHDNEIMNSLLNSQELRRLAYKIMFESSSPTRIDKGKKSGIKYDTQTPPKSPKQSQAIYRPDYELVNRIMFDIRNTIRAQQIDDEIMIRIAKMTFTLLENPQATSSTGLERRSTQIDRHLISPKELYRKMKTFDVRDRQSFFSCYEAYLQTLFVMKIVNDDANNINLANKKPREGNIINDSLVASASALSLSNEDVQNLRRHAQVCKSNIPIINSNELNLGLNANRKSHYDDASGGIMISNASCPVPNDDYIQQSGQHNPHHSHSADIPLAFGNGIVSSSDQSNEQVSSPCTNSNNNIMNEDLAEADQICSSSSSAIITNSCNVVHPTQMEVASAVTGNSVANSRRSSRGSFSLEHPSKRPLIEDYLDEDEIIGENEKKDCNGAGGDGVCIGIFNGPSTYQNNYNREAQVNSNAKREMDEDGFDVFGKNAAAASQLHGKIYAGQNGTEMNTNSISNINGSVGIMHTDCNNSDGAVPIMNDAACAVIYPTASSLDSTVSTLNLTNSIPEINNTGINNSNNNLINNHNACGDGTKQRNSVP